MNCLSYARVSTDRQAEEELSVPAQLHQAMRQNANDRGWKILGQFVEAGASATTVERPTLRQLLNRRRLKSLHQSFSKPASPKVDRASRRADALPVSTLGENWIVVGCDELPVTY
jgi:site-specific DNA recombinase